MSSLELWGGVECTLNRVGHRYYDQIARTGHADRIDDLDRFASLGLRALRYPILWERTAPAGIERAEWQWTDARLQRLQALGIRPIAGLVHHGSGPDTTSVLHRSFVSGLAAYAGAVARRYPWIDAYTPVNEPLTTARFSALYGHWYPHRSDDAAFVQALLNQVTAIREAMRAVRAVNPQALLVQTEDIAEISGTSQLRHQVDFENLRRWLSLDLLCGRVTSDHELWPFLRDARADLPTLESLHDDPCPPDIIGLNYYLTSDRYLDHRVHRYRAPAGGNGRDRYVDIEAVRVPGVRLAGHAHHLRSAFARYRRPVALTEVHAACSREEQIRWFAEAWQSAIAVRRAGVDVTAVTAWSLLGAFDWDTLVTKDRGVYESGAYDLRTVPPRPTALVEVLRAVGRDGQLPDLPFLDSPGWWRRTDTARDEAADEDAADAVPRPRLPRRPRPLLILGRRGTLGQALARACEARGLAHVLASRAMVDIADPSSVNSAIDRYRPWAVVNAAGYVDVDRAEVERDRCRRENSTGPAVLAAACAAAGIRLATFSSDLVFDGIDAKRPYLEVDRCRPLNTYGRTKLEAEAAVLSNLPGALIVRTSAFFGPVDGANFVTQLLDRLHRGLRCEAADDVTITATYVPDLAHTTLDLLIDDEHGVWHLANPGPMTWAQLARSAAERIRLPLNLIIPVPSAALGWTAIRPRYSALASMRGSLMRPIDDALDAYVAAVGPHRQEVHSCA